MDCGRDKGFNFTVFKRLNGRKASVYSLHYRGREGLRRFLHTSSHMHGRVPRRGEIQLMRPLINLKLWITLAQVRRKEIPERIGKQMIGPTQACLVGAVKGHVRQFAHQRAAPLAWRDASDKRGSRCTLFKLKLPLMSVQERVDALFSKNRSTVSVISGRPRWV